MNGTSDAPSSRAATAALTAEMRRLIETYSAGMVATVNADGSPAVSPKGTFVVLDETTLAFGDLRSPGTIANLERSPSVEVCFLDVLAREALRVRGAARIVALDALGDAARAAFEARWAEYLPHMRRVVKIDVTAAELVRSPAYDLGHRREELVATNLAKLDAAAKRREA